MRDLLEGLLRPPLPGRIHHNRNRNRNRGLGASSRSSLSVRKGKKEQQRGAGAQLVLGQVIDLRPTEPSATDVGGTADGSAQQQHRRKKRQLGKQSPELNPTRLRQLELTIAEAATLSSAAASAATVDSSFGGSNPESSLSGEAVAWPAVGEDQDQATDDTTQQGKRNDSAVAVVSLWWTTAAELHALQTTADLRRRANATTLLAKQGGSGSGGGGSSQRDEFYSDVVSPRGGSRVARQMSPAELAKLEAVRDDTRH